MRGIDHQQSQMFSYLSPETRVRKDHPLRAIRSMVDEVLARLSRRFDTMYASAGRPSIPPEKLLRAQLLQMLYSIRSERLLMEEIDYSLLFRWFVGLNLDEEVWDATTFTKNRDRLLAAEVAKEFLTQVVTQASGPAVERRGPIAKPTQSSSPQRPVHRIGGQRHQPQAAVSPLHRVVGQHQEAQQNIQSKSQLHKPIH
jgi:transposase